MGRLSGTTLLILLAVFMMVVSGCAKKAMNPNEMRMNGGGTIIGNPAPLLPEDVEQANIGEKRYGIDLWPLPSIYETMQSVLEILNHAN